MTIWRKKTNFITDAVEIISNNPSLHKFFREALTLLPAVEEKVVSRCHLELVLKAIHSRAGQVFKLFHERFIGHY